MYKLTQGASIIRVADGACIAADLANTDYQQYLLWISVGNTPDPADAPNQNDMILEQIKQIEDATGVPRVVREMMLTYAEDLAQRTADQMTAGGTPTTPEQLLFQNIAYVKTKAVDDQIRALRSQLK